MNGWKPHAQLEGSICVRGVTGHVEVLRDHFGVPHIFADHEQDAFFGQGFVHAQDRLFQIDSMRRLASGRLSEVTGASSLESDRFMRRLGLEYRAVDDLEQASDEEQLLLESYAQGLNEGMRSLDALPPEFVLMNGTPDLWRPEYSLLIGRMMLFTFASNWDTELLREQLVSILGSERAAAVDPVYPAGARTSAELPQIPAEERLLAAYRRAQEAGLFVGTASNAWAIAGDRTESGFPLLANDPHLRARLPGLFHVCHISGGELDSVGATIPGIPGVVIGHNGVVAWGLTAGLADVSDCYIETVDPENPHRYLTPQGWMEGHFRTERILVRGHDDVEEQVLETRHGPVIGPALAGEQRAVTLRSTALEQGDLALGFLGLMRAADTNEFELALDRWPGSSFNIVWATTGGDIGYRLVGRVPERIRGEGLLPQDGASSDGPPNPLPTRSLPRLVNPSSGVVVSANNAPGGTVELGEEWCEPWRADRIRELLDERNRHTVASMQSVQLDLQSGALLDLCSLVLEITGVVDEEWLSELLRSWDGQLTADSAPGALLGLSYRRLANTLVTRVAGPMASTILGGNDSRSTASATFHYRLQGHLIDILRTPELPWFDDVLDRDRVLRASVRGALSVLRARFGEDPNEWAWGSVRPLILDHPLNGIPLLGKHFSRGPYPHGGDVNTVWQGGHSVQDGAEGGYDIIPAYRQVIDLSNFDRSAFQIPGGNSGVPGQGHYDDCISEYLDGRYRPLLYSRVSVERHTEYKLDLQSVTSDVE